MDKTLRNRSVMFVLLLFIVLPVCYAFYANNHAINPTAHELTVITNQSVLLEVLPQDVVNVIAKTLVNYGVAQTHAANNYTYTVDSKVSSGTGSYIYNIKPSYGGDDLRMKVFVDGSEGLPAITVSINNTLQPAVN